MKPHSSRHWTLLLLASLGILACGPRIDPAAKADVDRRLSLLTAKKNAYPPLDLFVPRPLAVGQWTQMKLVSDKGEAAIYTYKIVGELDGAYWFEVVNDSYFGKTVTKILLFIGDRKNPSTMEVRQVMTKDKDGKVNVFEGSMLSLMKSMWNDTINLLSIAWEGQPREDVKVLAGKFASCFKVRSEANFGPFHAASMSWSHPAVPINGLVRSAGIDRPNSMELIAFGDKGAKSEIP
jgi:hypothetical protein